MEKIKSLTSIRYKLKTPDELPCLIDTKSDTSIVISESVLQSDKYTKEKIGLSAQEVQLVYPELVKEDSRGYLSVNYIGLVPVLVEAIKEQDELLQLQQEEIEELRALVEGLLVSEKQ